MMLFWKIRYWHRAERQFKDRCLYLATESLDPVMRAAVEPVVEDESLGRQREILKYKQLFREDRPAPERGDPYQPYEIKGVFLPNYFEDESGQEIAPHDLGPLVTGSPTAMLIPPGLQKHDIDLMMADRRSIPVAEVVLGADDIRILGIFARDLREMTESTFMKDRPGTLSLGGSYPLSAASNPRLKTAANDDEIRSFVTVFRRLYMEKDPANFLKAVEVFVRAIGDHPYAAWVASVAAEFRARLASRAGQYPFIPRGACTFTVKRLIDVFVYTQYAHQPNHQRQQQFAECLNQVSGKQDVLTWLFLTEMWYCSLEIQNAGRVISGWFNRYCEYHGISPDVPPSLRDNHPGLGVLEKDQERRARLFQEKVERVAADLWRRDGCPEGGPQRFFGAAREQLNRMLEGRAL
jgi:hypothetical protein